MTVKIYMKDNEKVKYHQELFEDYNSGLYCTISKCVSITDFYLDYRFYDKDGYVLKSMSKEMFYFVVKEN